MNTNIKTKSIFTLLKEKSHLIFCIALSVIIFFVNFEIVNDCSHPFVFNDEAGYWTHAATLAGFDWSGISGGLSWYSFGFSILLVPLIKIISDTTILYRAVIILNILMIEAVYFIYCKIIAELFPKINKYVIYLISATAVLYTSYQVQIGIAWSETALVLVSALIMLFVMRTAKKPGYVNICVLAALSVYIYMVHNRCLGIVASVIFVLAIMLIFKKIKMRHIAAFFIMLAVGIVINTVLKNNLEALIWGANGRPSGNDLGSVTRKLKDAFTTVSGFKLLISMIASQSFAVFVSAFCIPLFSLWIIVKKIIINISAAVKKHKTKKNLTESFDYSFYTLAFIFCAFLATLVISSVFMLTYSRIDHIVYTRYVDMLVGPLIALGLCSLISADKKDISFMFTIPIIIFFGINRADALINHVESTIFNSLCSPGIASMYTEYGTDFAQYFMICIVIWSTITVLTMLIKKYYIGICTASVFCSVLFVMNSDAGKLNIKGNQKLYNEDTQLLRRLEELPDRNIYVTENCGTFRHFCQFTLMDKKVNVISDIESIDETSYIIADRMDIINLSEYELLDQSDRHIIVSNTQNNDESELKKLPLSYMNTFNEAAYNASSDSISSLDDINYLCYGPYLNIDPGEYLFEVNLAANELNAENVGFVECKSSFYDTVYAHIDISADMFDDKNKYTAELNPEFALPLNDLEIIVFIYEPQNVSMTLNSIKYMEEN